MPGGGVWRSLVGRLRAAVLAGRRGYAGDGGWEAGRAGRGRGGRRGGDRRGGGGGRADGSRGPRGGQDGGRDGRGGRLEGWWDRRDWEGGSWGGSGGGRGWSRGGRGRGWGRGRGRGGSRGPDIGPDAPGEEAGPAEGWWSARWRQLREVTADEVLGGLDDLEGQLQRVRRIQQIPDVAVEVWTRFYEAAAAVGLAVAGAYTFVRTKAEKLKEKLSPRKTRPDDGGDVIEPIGPLDFSP